MIATLTMLAHAAIYQTDNGLATKALQRLAQLEPDDVWHQRLPFIEIYGTEGTLSTPDPNRFDGPVYIRRANDETWHEVPLTHGYIGNSRGIGIADMAHAMRSGRLHRAHGDMAFHVLDIIESLMQSATEGRHITLTSTCARPAPLNPGVYTWKEDRTE